MCRTDFKGNPLCSTIDCASCDVGTASLVPTASNASMSIYNICNQMPMKDCGICPNPDPVTLISKCDSLLVLSDLCKDMPGMRDCQQYQTFCNAYQSTKYCSGSSANPGSNNPGNTNTTSNRSSAESLFNGIIWLFLLIQ